MSVSFCLEVIQKVFMQKFNLESRNRVVFFSEFMLMDSTSLVLVFCCSCVCTYLVILVVMNLGPHPAYFQKLPLKLIQFLFFLSFISGKTGTSLWSHKHSFAPVRLVCIEFQMRRLQLRALLIKLYADCS